MAICTLCFGSGKVTCHYCSGRGYKNRLTSSGDMDMSPCAVCGGSGKIRCGPCMGRGQIPDYRPGDVEVPPGDPLAGRWISKDGSWLVFVHKEGLYSVEVGSAQGDAGSGTATLDGSEVRIQVRILLFINYSTTLSLEENTLRGKLKIGPIAMPMMFTRCQLAEFA